MSEAPTAGAHVVATRCIVGVARRGVALSDLSRRELIRICGLGALGCTARRNLAAAQQEIPRTPGQILGPFHPVINPADHDVDGETARNVTNGAGPDSRFERST